MGKKVHTADVEMPCLHCSKPFMVVGSQLTPYKARGDSTRKYCSPRCYNEARKIPVPTFDCACCGKTVDRKKNRHATGRLGSYNYNQIYCSISCAAKSQPRKSGTGAGSIDKNGYRILSRGRGVYVAEHRVVMEKIIGRKLLRSENVHHINGDRQDNRPENLEIWNKTQPCGQRVKDKVAWAIEILRLYPEVARESGVALGNVPEVGEVRKLFSIGGGNAA